MYADSVTPEEETTTTTEEIKPDEVVHEEETSATVEETTPEAVPETETTETTPEPSFDYEAYFNVMTRDELYQFLKMNEVVGVSRYKKEQLFPLAIKVAKEKGLSK